jgi:hypothetical protein
VGGRTGAVKLQPGQRAAAEQTWRAASALLESGAQGAGLVLVDELLRAVHTARIAGLHRLSAAGARAAQQVRDLHARRPEFRLASFGWDVLQLLSVSHALRTTREDVEARWIGEARRGYSDVGSLRLSGLFTEAVASTAGYAGAVTYLVDEDATIWSLADIAPGQVQRCRFAYVTAFDLGEASLDHRALCRGELRLEHARAADNRRLGGGRRVIAELTEGVGWHAPPLSRMWDSPLEAQLERAWSVRDQEKRQAGDDLLFIRTSVLGTSGAALVLQADHTTLYGVAPSAHAELPYRRNLRLLGAVAGVEVLAIGRIVFAQPRTVQLLAVGGAGLMLPEDWNGRANLGLDTLRARYLPRTALPAPAARKIAPAASDPLDALERRLDQVLLGGRSAISAATWSGFLTDEAELSASQLGTGAALLRRLRETPTPGLAEAWLAARLYLAAARGYLERDAWLA